MAVYRKKGKICNCTLGAIYLAYDQEQQCDVVLKQLSFPADNDMRHLRAFVATIDDARKLQHEHIMSIYGITHEAFDVSVAMELMRCKTLLQKLEAGASFSVNAALSIGIQLANALQYAHDSGIYHGSVNAGHVYLRKDGVVKLNNFGFNYNVEGVLIGPPTSRAPEQWLGEPLSRSSDVYGLGILLYQLLSGRFPYRANNADQLRDRVLNLPPLQLESLAPKVPFDLHEVIMRAISKDPADRFATMSDMEMALREAAQSPNVSNGTDAFLIHELNNQPYVANDIDFSRSHWPLQILNAWPARRVEGKGRSDMVRYLLDPSQHSAPFSGVAIIDLNTMLLCWQGYLIACIDVNTHQFGDAVLQAVPESAEEMVLFTPISLHLRPFALLLATILRDPTSEYNTLHSDQFVASEFVSKLEHDQFTGVLRLRFGDHMAWIGFERGVYIFMLKNDYTATPVENNASCDLDAATAGVAYDLDIFSSHFTPLQAGLACLFRDFSLQPSVADKRTPASLLKMKPKQLSGAFRLEYQQAVSLTPVEQKVIPEAVFAGKKIIAEDLLVVDESYRFSKWLLSEAYAYLLSEGHKDALKYMVTWLAEVSRVCMHHSLIDEAGVSHAFDVVTYDAEGKVLHVIKRGPAQTTALDDFVHEVTAVKEHLDASGGLGAALYWCDANVSDALKEARDSHVMQPRKSILRMGALDVFTGLRSFVRLGPNRGFHLLLVEAQGESFRVVDY